MTKRIVIVGASLTGASAAVALRHNGFDGSVTMIGAETHTPYERPPLSKEYLRGEAAIEKAFVKPPEWYAENNVELLLGRKAERIDVSDRSVLLDGGEKIGYDDVLIATGGRNRVLRAPGAELDGIYQLRTVADADRIRASATDCHRAVVVGMGFIGAEVASSLRAMGVEVTAVEPLPTPLFRVLGGEVGTALAALHADHGVNLVTEDIVESFEGSGRVSAVVTKSGRRIECNLVVAGIGIEPVTEVVADTPVEVDNGILVDELCRTNVEGVYAAGDVANHLHPIFGRRMRVEHWQNAMRHGTHAAQSMMGSTEPYSEIHWFWSDQYDANLQYAGHHTTWDELVFRGSVDARSFLAFYIKDGLLDAAVGFNRGKELRRAMGIIKARRPVDAAKLKDEDVDLKTLAD
jgi:3-phenylpropionate/trans-cinnamate dioxygenase ferredoxin reductase component